MSRPAEKIADIVKDYIKELLLQKESFTGKVELHFKDGELMDGYEKKKILKKGSDYGLVQ